VYQQDQFDPDEIFNMFFGGGFGGGGGFGPRLESLLYYLQLVGVLSGRRSLRPGGCLLQQLDSTDDLVKEVEALLSKS
jgi:hypothetical protein